MSERMTLDEAKAMLGRAQASELKLLEQMVQKDATIKALADALYAQGTFSDTHGEWHTRGCWLHRSKKGECITACKTATAALRLVGRLP